MAKLQCQTDARKTNKQGGEYVVTFQLNDKSIPVTITKALDVMRVVFNHFGAQDPKTTRKQMKKAMVKFDEFLTAEIMSCKTNCKTAPVCAKSKKLLDLSQQTMEIMQKYHFAPAA